MKSGYVNALCAASIVLSLSACATGTDTDGDLASQASEVPMLPRPTGATLVFECQDYDFIARTGPGELAVWLHDRYLVLGQVRAASGSRYEGDGVVVWLKGDEALLEDHGSRWSGCRQAPRRVPWEDARRRGVDFRGVGNEPGWHVEVVEGQHMLFVGAYGAQRLLLADPVRQQDGDTVIYRAVEGDNTVAVEVGQVSCSDTMSGDRFPVTVDVTVNGDSLRGCGMFLERHWD